MIKLTDYCRQRNINIRYAEERARRGTIPAVRVGGRWFIDGDYDYSRKTEINSNHLLNKICKICGVHFIGGGKSTLCPNCQNQRNNELRHKTVRHIGSIDRCQNCSAEYIVNSGRQRFCADCAAEMIKLYDRERKRTYYTKNRNEINNTRRKYRKSKPLCPVCGQPVENAKNATCSNPDCIKLWQSAKNKRADDKRK